MHDGNLYFHLDSLSIEIRIATLCATDIVHTRCNTQMELLCWLQFVRDTIGKFAGLGSRPDSSTLSINKLDFDYIHYLWTAV